MEDFPDVIPSLPGKESQRETESQHEMPLIPDLSSVVENSSTNRDTTPPDMTFLKKMNALSTGHCSIDNFVTISRKRKGTHGCDTDIVSDKSAAQDWMCDDCNAELIYIRKDAQRVCQMCGKSSFFQEMTRGDMISQGYTPTTAYLYKRQNHFKTWLKRTQGMETTSISTEITDMVKKELKKERISDMSTVDHIKIKSILKTLRQNKYYNHCVQITTIVTGKVPPQMTTEQKDSLS